MSRRSGNDDPNEALELFLDTISNTFGGVLFISMLVCVLLQLSGSGASGTSGEVDKVQAATLQLELDKLNSEIESTKQRLDNQTKQMKLLQTNAADPESVDRFFQLKEVEQQLRDQQRTLNRQATTQQTTISKAQDRKRDIDEQMKQLQKAMLTLKEAFEQQDASVKVRLPRFKATAKREIPLLLEGGRYAFVSHYDATGKVVSLNRKDMEFGQVVIPGRREQASTVKLRAGSGSLVSNADVFKRNLAQALSPFNAAHDYIAIAVWPDSFDQCETLRDALLEMSFEYNLILMEAGKPVISSTGAGGTQ